MKWTRLPTFLPLHVLDGRCSEDTLQGLWRIWEARKALREVEMAVPEHQVTVSEGHFPQLASEIFLPCTHPLRLAMAFHLGADPSLLSLPVV